MGEPLLKIEALNVSFTTYGRTRQVLRDISSPSLPGSASL